MPSAASRRLEPRLPPPPPPLRPRRRRRDPSQPSLAQFVVLSMLLHALFILLFGSPAGGSREGRAMWGSLDVTIRGPLLDSGIGLGRDRGQPLPLPGTELIEKRERRREAAAPPPPAPAEARREPPDLEAARVADVPAPAPLAPIVPATAPPVELAPAPRIDPARTEVRVIPVPAIDWTPVAESAAAPRIEAPLVDAPRVEAPPRRAPAPVVPSPMLREAGSAVPVPRLAPDVQFAPLPRPAPPRPVTIDSPSLAAPLQAAPAPVAAPTLAPPAEIAPLPAPAPPVTIESSSLAPPLQAAPVPEVAPALAPPARVDSGPPAAAPARAAPAGPAGRDSPIFDNRRAPPADVPIPGTGPRIDLEAAKARAREIAREGTGNRALLPFPMPPAPERKTKEQVAIEKAWKPDCKDAYKGLGLLAVVPLIANEFGEGNCRW